MKYLYETHVHESRCSLCASSTAEEMVRAYHRAGYAGLVLTDHFIFGNTAIDRSQPWNIQMEEYYNAFLSAKEVGNTLDFDVIFGFEHQYGGGKEVLIYGIDLPFLLSNPDIPHISIDEFARRIHEAGGLIIEAHPYRDRPYINMAVPPRWDLLDGVEVYNACSLPGEDLKALMVAEGKDYILTSGGDIHRDSDPRIGHAGILLPRRVKTTQEFAQILRENIHHFRINGQDMTTVTPEDLTYESRN